MTATATLTVDATNPSRVDWGDGNTEKVAAGTSTLTHTYPGEGTWRVTVQDLTTFALVSQLLECASSCECPPVPAHVDNFTTPGEYTWTKPDGVRLVDIIIASGGGGGGSGRRGAAGTLRGGGGGGNGGGYVTARVAGADLPDTAPVVVGAGGLGGAAVTVDDTNGNAGGLGVPSIFAGVYRAWSANQGMGGSASAGGTSGSPNGQINAGGAGGNGTGFMADLGGFAVVTSSPGGGGGGGLSVADFAQMGGAAQGSLSLVTGGITGGGSGGVTGASPSDPVQILPSWGYPFPVGASGAGGGAGSAGPGGNGANGLRGGGGGGGGASVNGYPSGAGGNGGDGFVQIISYF